jgi:hypothetical protein
MIMLPSMERRQMPSLDKRYPWLPLRVELRLHTVATRETVELVKYPSMEDCKRHVKR